MAYAARIVCDSLAPCGKRLVTYEVTLPRTALAEIRTHRQILEEDEVELTFRGTDEAGRVFSMNSASSRAIPVEKMIQQVMDDPYIPEFTGAQKGMQGKTVEDEEWQATQRARVLYLRDEAVRIVRAMLDDGVHKQDANRYLEPFMWHTLILSATEWSNFFAQRTDGMAYPPLDKIACMMQELYNTQEPTPLEAGDWHLPYLQPDEVELPPIHKRRLSIARCARVSYLSHLGVRDHEEDFRLYERLEKGQHFSPFEHVACAMQTPLPSGNFIGFSQFRKCLSGECR